MIEKPKRMRKVNASLNWTGRKVITRDRFKFEINWPEETGPPTLSSINVNLKSLGLSKESKVAVTMWTTISSRRMSIHLGQPPFAEAKDVFLSEIGRTNFSLEITVEDSEGKILAAAKPIRISPPSPDDPKPPRPGSYGKETRVLVAFNLDESDELGPDQAVRVIFPEAGYNQQATILINSRTQSLWHLASNPKPAHAYRKLLLESAIYQITDKVIADAKNELFDPSKPLTKDDRWNSWMHDFLRSKIPDGQGLDTIDINDPDDVKDWRERAIEHFLQGYRTPVEIEAALNPYGGDY